MSSSMSHCGKSAQLEVTRQISACYPSFIPTTAHAASLSSCSVYLQVQRGAETHSGVQPAGDGELRGLRGYAEQGDDQGQHRSSCTARGPQRNDGGLL